MNLQKNINSQKANKTYLANKTISPSTIIKQIEKGNFIYPHNNNQIVINKNTHLDFYEILNSINWIHTYKIYGNIDCIKTFNETNIDNIILLINNSKIVIIKWTDYEFKVIEMFDLNKYEINNKSTFYNFSISDNGKDRKSVV